MKKYLVYLTKSAEVAHELSNAIMAKALSNNGGIERVEIVSGNNPAVPEVYHGKGYCCCIVTYAEDAEAEPYRLVIA